VQADVDCAAVPESDLGHKHWYGLENWHWRRLWLKHSLKLKHWHWHWHWRKSGGNYSVTVRIEQSAFEPAEALKHFEASQQSGKVGATASFVGTMRSFNEGDDVCAMTLEHYPGMTERELEAVIKDAADQWPLIDALIVHRVGDIKPGEAIVLTAVSSAHRAAAFDACRFLMEALKSRAPFWKKETLVDGSTRWVEKNTPG